MRNKSVLQEAQDIQKAVATADGIGKAAEEAVTAEDAVPESDIGAIEGAGDGERLLLDQAPVDAVGRGQAVEAVRLSAADSLEPGVGAQAGLPSMKGTRLCACIPCHTTLFLPPSPKS